MIIHIILLPLPKIPLFPLQQGLQQSPTKNSSFYFLTAAAVIFTAAAVVIFYKKKYYKNDKPENCAAALITTAITKKIKHLISYLSYLLFTIH